MLWSLFRATFETLPVLLTKYGIADTFIGYTKLQARYLPI